MPGRDQDLPKGFVPVTPDEQRRIGVVLAAVSTRTLLQSLARLNADNVDAALIIAELLGRLPAGAGSFPGDAAL